MKVIIFLFWLIIFSLRLFINVISMSRIIQTFLSDFQSTLKRFKCIPMKLRGFCAVLLQEVFFFNLPTYYNQTAQMFFKDFSFLAFLIHVFKTRSILRNSFLASKSQQIFVNLCAQSVMTLVSTDPSSPRTHSMICYTAN